MYNIILSFVLRYLFYMDRNVNRLVLQTRTVPHYSYLPFLFRNCIEAHVFTLKYISSLQHTKEFMNNRYAPLVGEKCTVAVSRKKSTQLRHKLSNVTCINAQIHKQKGPIMTRPYRSLITTDKFLSWQSHWILLQQSSHCLLALLIPTLERNIQQLFFANNNVHNTFYGPTESTRVPHNGKCEANFGADRNACWQGIPTQSADCAIKKQKSKAMIARVLKLSTYTESSLLFDETLMRVLLQNLQQEVFLNIVRYNADSFSVLSKQTEAKQQMTVMPETCKESHLERAKCQNEVKLSQLNVFAALERFVSNAVKVKMIKRYCLLQLVTLIRILKMKAKTLSRWKDKNVTFSIMEHSLQKN